MLRCSADRRTDGDGDGDGGRVDRFVLTRC